MSVMIQREKPSRSNQQTWRTALILTVVLGLISTFCLNQIFHRGNHSFHRLDKWFNHKLMGRNLMGSTEFILQRQTLAHDQLNLGEWHGHNHVLWDQPGPWREISVDMKLAQDAYLWILLSESPSEIFGFRISRSSEFSSGFFRLASSGEILERKPVSLIISPSWNRLNVKFDEKSVTFYLNSQEVLTTNQSLTGPTFLSFRNGIHPVSLDNLTAKRNLETLHQDFSPPFQFQYLITAVFFYFAFLFFLFLAHLKIRPLREKLFLLLFYHCLITLFLGFYEWYDRQVLSKSYFFDGHVPFDRVKEGEGLSDFEKKRTYFFNALESLAGLKKPYPVPKPSKDLDSIFGFGKESEYKNFDTFQLNYPDGKIRLIDNVSKLPALLQADLKIVTMGTSQTWGAGVPRVDSNFVAKMIKGLNEELKIRVLGFDQSICGVQIPELFGIYKEILMKWNPDVLIVNLSNNDGANQDQFREYLIQIAQMNRDRKIKTFFVLEANDMQSPGYVKHTHPIMKSIADVYGIPVFDLNEYLALPEIRDSGLIWFDVVHLDQWGHQLVADWLVRNLLKSFKTSTVKWGNTVPNKK